MMRESGFIIKDSDKKSMIITTAPPARDHHHELPYYDTAITMIGQGRIQGSKKGGSEISNL